MLDLEMRHDSTRDAERYTCTVTEYPITVDDLRQWALLLESDVDAAPTVARHIRTALGQNVRTKDRRELSRVTLEVSRVSPATQVATVVLGLAGELLDAAARRAFERVARPSWTGEG